MNVTEAIHVQVLLSWLTDPHLSDDQGAEAARESAAILAAAARRRLGAGLTGEQVTAGWADLLTSCPGCPACQSDQPNQPAAVTAPAVVDGGARAGVTSC